MTTLDVKTVKVKTVEFTLKGTSPLVCHGWHVRDPGYPHPRRAVGERQRFRDAIYRSPEGWCGIPVGMIRKAVAGAAAFVGLKSFDVKTKIWVEHDGFERSRSAVALIRLTGKPEMRKTIIRCGGVWKGDRLIQAEFKEWSARPRISYIADSFTENVVLALVVAAGSIGIASGRPENGRWECMKHRSVGTVSA